ncbi:dehydrogenase, short-chain alcohol dehydrogenase [Rheinheimera sp. A13L]|uniref:SDR family NAD(P)-dependent oxidoreductase n=1 Tax=Rheinheimera sp. A13L TaxID=506534 RepID=UPI0002125068|nr:SDR family oxidoreductase [Rheinheimera sp. A13L]EGM79563.1 dehydrogenase, short-chain alcohol dehydrogenase [Rheinheimera sp. A13L]
MSQKIALITGASRGLGKNAALALAKAGVDLVLTYHSKADEAAAVVAEVQALGRKAVAIQLDTSNVSSFAEFSAQLATHLQQIWQRDQFDFLVNNAGFGIYAALNETTEQQFDALMNVHLKGVFFLTQQLLPQIADEGRILNYSSGLTRFALPGYGAYAAMKGAVEVLSRYLALESGARGIRVNTLAPGAIETDFGGGAVRDNADINHYIASQTALGRVGLPDDIGGVVQMLLSEQSGWINGQRIEVSGGIHL